MGLHQQPRLTFPFRSSPPRFCPFVSSSGNSTHQKSGLPLLIRQQPRRHTCISNLISPLISILLLRIVEAFEFRV
ncbi:hypothetical protein AAC387_Pa09g0830 [Persea americana]